MRMKPVPFIPESAPFSVEQRLWLNGYLAGLFSYAPAESNSKPKPRVLLLWGSQSGNAQGLCRQFAQQLNGQGFEARALSMESHTEVDLLKEERLLIVSSTWGEGEPPDNAAEFWKKLSAESHPRLEKLSYSVLALGDSNYLDFCAMGKRFDARLEALGAGRCAPRVDCDVDFEEAAAAWIQSVAKAFNAGAPEPELAPAAVAASWSRKNPFPGKLLANRRLNAAGSERDTRHFEISLEGSSLSYEVGDVLGVYPSNCPALVQELLAALGCDGEEGVVDPEGNEVALRTALTRHYTITTPSQKLLQAFAVQPDGRELIDLLRDFPALMPKPTELVSLLGKLAPRLYPSRPARRRIRARCTSPSRG